MVQSPSWEANWFAASQEIPRISRNPKVHYRTHKRPPPVSVLGQPNPVHIPTSHLLEIHPNIIHPEISYKEVKRRKANWIGHSLRSNCHLKHVIEEQIAGKKEVTGRRMRRHRQLLGNLKDKTGYWKLKEEALDRIVWRTSFGRGYGPVVRQTAEWLLKS